VPAFPCQWTVTSPRGQAYRVDIPEDITEEETCTCPAWYGGKRPCKHTEAVRALLQLVPILRGTQ